MAAAAAQWLFWQLPAWLGSALLWFVILNVVVAAIAALSSLSPRRGGITRRASSAAFNRMRTFSLFSYPSSCFNAWPEAATATFPEREEPATAPRRSPSALRVAPTAAEPEGDTDGEGGEGTMTMEEAYALAVAGRQQPPPTPTEEEVNKSEVDVKADEFIRGLEEDLRQKRLASIFNYTQMLKNRAAAGRRPAEAAPGTNH